MVLEWSKLIMYRTFAAFKNHFGNRLHMGYKDTDAVVFIIESDDAYAEIKSQPQLRDIIDFFLFPRITRAV